jgi:hypothetical protein
MRWIWVVAAGCGDPSGPYSASCELGCDEYRGEDEDPGLCAQERKQCVEACAEITAGASGPCAACLTTDGLQAPYSDDGLCELGYFDVSSCAQACDLAPTGSTQSR